MAINVLIEIPSYVSCIFILDKFGRRSTVIVTQLGKKMCNYFIYTLLKVLFSFWISLSCNFFGANFMGTLAFSVAINSREICNLSSICCHFSSSMIQNVQIGYLVTDYESYVFLKSFRLVNFSQLQ